MQTWGDLTDEQKAWAAEQLGRGVHYQTIETDLRIGPDGRDTFRRKLREWSAAIRAHSEYHETHIAEAPKCAKRWTEYPVIEGDHLILADPHCPYHDAPWMNRCIDLAEAWGVKRVGVVGDLFEQGVFSHFGRQTGVEWRDERKAAQQLIRALLTRFEQVTICKGNHEVRVIRKLEYAMDGADWDAMLYGEYSGNPKLNITQAHYFDVISGGERFRVTHPKNASVVPGSVASRIAAKLNCHVIAGHGHINGVRRDTGDRLWAIDVGMCADRERLSYTMLEDNTRPLMQKGAVVIIDGTPILLEPGNIGAYERMSYERAA